MEDGFEDNSGAITITTAPKYRRITKHINSNYGIEKWKIDMRSVS